MPTMNNPSSPEPLSPPTSQVSSEAPPSVGMEESPSTLPVIPEFAEGSLLWRVRGLVKATRPHQWVKNLFVFAPVVFANKLTSPDVMLGAFGAFGIFCLLAGAVYLMNDLVDVEADRVHPVKRHRPIASGRVSVAWAKAASVALVVVALGCALVMPVFSPAGFSPWLFLIAALYFGQNVAYSLRLKHVAYLDVGCIALGFVLRVLAGGVATLLPISKYMLVCTGLLALFLGFGKRRHELAGANASKQRAALDAYTPRALSIALGITGVLSVLVYFAYTRAPHVVSTFRTQWLWLTTFNTAFGVVRFLQLVAGRPKAESPTQEMLRDVPFVLNLVFWGLEVVGFIYNVRLTSG